jgi:hypothetical protein
MKPLLLMLFCFLPFQSAFASDPRSEVMSLEMELEGRINPIVRSYDPSAFGIVKIEAKQSQGATLPGTPLQIQDMMVRSADGSFEIEKLEINLVGNDVEALHEALPAIKRVAGRLGVPAVIRIEEKKVAIKAEAARGEEKKFEKATSSGELEAVAKDATNLLREGMDYLKNAFWAILGVSVIFCIVYLSGIGAMTGKVSRALEKGLSLRGDTEGRSYKEEKTESAPALRVVEANSFPPRSVSAPIAEFSEESILACLTDCYWGQFDGYAAFLWKQIPVAKRTSLILKAPSVTPFLVEYTSFISDVPAVDLGAIDSPAYLKPLPINHLDNRAVTEQVKKTPTLAGALSPLRLKSLQLSLHERFKLREIMGSGISVVGDHFTQTAMSPPRKIGRRFKIEVSSIVEDKELLGMATPPFDLVEEVCSLSWLTYLPLEELKSITEGFSARDLAAAWVGPEEVLEVLARSLPAKKLELLRSVQTKVQPNRDSQAFKVLHLALAKQLKKRSSSPEFVAGGRKVAHDRQKRAA